MSKRTFDEMSGSGQYTGLHTASLLESGLWSDLTIKCNDRAWKVHRLVIGLQSKPLAAAISGEFQEAKTGIIKLDDHNPEIVGHMISFLYSGDYTASKPQTEVEPEETAASETTPEENTKLETTTLNVEEVDTSQKLLVHTEVYLIAEEKDIPALKQLAKTKYEKALPNGWNSVAFCTSLRKIYEETPESDPLLWDVAINFAGKKAKELMDRGEFVELWKEKSEIGLEVFRAYISLQSSQASTAAAIPSTSAGPNTVTKFGSVFGTTPRMRIGTSRRTTGTCPDCASDGNVVTARGKRTWWCKSCRTAFD
ncbi:hypothetical protein N431DRAFT_549990 [Stipitochalara longipes BDJ]|nr:hypothetical protein N431DRAFT_549990 [Stipitochalara longipes BDJ]